MLNDSTKMCKKCKCVFPATTDFFGRSDVSRDGLRTRCNSCRRAQQREYSIKNRAREIERKRKYHATHRERENQYKREYKRRNPIVHRLGDQKRAARKRDLRSDLTIEQQVFAVEYFGNVCAVCGRPFYDLFGERTLHLDHWIPLASNFCPGTTATNMIPLCGGVDGCNTRKQARDPKEWLVSQFGYRKARKILARIEAYIEVVGARAEVKYD